MSETRITAKTFLTCNINLNNFLYESTPKGFAVVGTLLYLSNRLLYNPCVELNMHKKNQLGSTFIEMIKTLKRAPLLLVVFISILI